MAVVSSEKSIHAFLKEIWGYDEFRPLQKESINCVLDGRDSLTVLPTGGGKSLCFQVPALCREGLAVVVSPLISLMKDQVDALQACGVSAAFVNSTQSPDEKRQVAEQIRRGDLKLLYVAPERLLSGKTLDFLMNSNVSFFAIDEAHCISNWGHDFRPEYRGLSILKDQFASATVHAYTATASEAVRKDICSQLGLENPSVLVGDFDRPNLVYRMLRSNNRLGQVMEVVERHKGESGIVYCISRKEVEKVALALERMGVTALPYHAGLEDSVRKANQDKFIKEQCDVIVATVAFGMGIDKSNVRYVVHAGMPKSIEHYQQESGRAGRDGLESECILIYSGGDVVTWKKIMEGDSREAYEGAVRSLNSLSDLCTGTSCRHRSLVEYFGQDYTQENCGACDVCLDELDLVDDPITLSQKILSCVLRLHERYGAGHTANVLVGSTEARIKQNGHDKLSTYGLLREETSQSVRMWIDQLVSQGYLLRSGEYHVLSLSESGRRLLRRDGDPKLTVPAKSKSRSRSAASADSWEGVDRGLFDALRSLRSQIASENNVPAYIVFGDATLRELARVRPDSLSQMNSIKGVGQKKLEDYGQAFLDALDQYCSQNELSRNVTIKHSAPSPVKKAASAPNASAIEAFSCFRMGESVEEVAEKMNRAQSTVCGYLQNYLAHEKITDCSPWVDGKTKQRILDNLDKMEEGRMRPLYEFLNAGESTDEVSYNAIRIVLTCINNEESEGELEPN